MIGPVSANVMSQTFRERYCSLHTIPPEQFEEHLLQRTLYWHARMIRTFLGLIPGYLVADRDFLRNVGDLRSRRLFHAEASEYRTWEANRAFARKVLRLRVSADRTRQAMEECWDSSETSSPIASAGH